VSGTTIVIVSIGVCAVVSAIVGNEIRGERMRSLRKGGRALAIVLVLALAVPAAWAVSLFDVIQLTRKGYRDDQIIAIIQATGSRFEVDAETILTLKREGVREKVIQAVIAASDGAPGADRAERTAAPARDRDDDSWRSRPASEHELDAEQHSPQQHPSEPVAESESAMTREPERTGASLSFSTYPFEEASAGDHQHQVIALAEVPIIILRSEAGFPTIADRARAAVEALNRWAADPSSIEGSHHGVVARTAGGRKIEILKVVRGDVIGLQRRSVGPIDAGRVGAYWASLLGDYADLAAGREPTRLTSFGIRSVQTLHREVMRTKSSGVSTDLLLEAVDRLPSGDRLQLVELAGSLPARFRSTEEHHETH